MKPDIGLIGVGLMGHGIARNILKHGYKLTAMAHPGNRPLDELLSLGATTRDSPAEVAAVFDLTPGEARVACEICADARTLGETAAALRVSINTVKTHLKRVYDKTGARSRNELAMLLASSAGGAHIELRHSGDLDRRIARGGDPVDGLDCAGRLERPLAHAQRVHGANI